VSDLTSVGWVAQMDQAAAGVRSIVSLVGAYYRAMLAEEGMTEAQAGVLTVEYQRLLFRTPRDPADGA